MTEYEKAKRLMFLMAQRAAEVLVWDECCDPLMENLRTDFIKIAGRINLSSLTLEELKEIGCGLWDEESNLYLIPLYLYDFLEYGQELGCIDGTTIIVRENYHDINSPNYIDNDIRVGKLSYGVLVNQFKKISKRK